MKYAGLKLVLLGALLWTACKKDNPQKVDDRPWYSVYPDDFPSPIIPGENQPNAARIELGKALFYDPILSIDSSISCASCHAPSLAFADSAATTPGVFQRPGTRNVPSLFNLAYQPHYLREASLPTLEMQILVPIQEHNEFAHNIVDIGVTLSKIPFYDSLSRLAYGQEPGPYSITRSIAAFERTLISANSAYDQARRGQRIRSSAEEKGYQLFLSDRLNCAKCHSEPFFTNFQPENNGLYMTYKDPGRFRFSKLSEDSGSFKIPSLRNVALTPPYMHDGSIRTLNEVIDFYASGGANNPNKNPLIQGFTLSPEEKSDLIIFLQSLSDSSFVKNPNYRP